MLPAARIAALVLTTVLGSCYGCYDFSLSGGPAQRKDAVAPGVTEAGAGGGGAGGAVDAAVDAAPSEIHVLIRNLSFSPREVHVKVGTTVVWDMMDTGTFHFVVEGSPGNAMPGFESPRLDTGTSWSRKFTAAGTYTYFCSNHSTVMRGNHIVVDP